MTVRSRLTCLLLTFIVGVMVTLTPYNAYGVTSKPPSSATQTAHSSVPATRSSFLNQPHVRMRPTGAIQTRTSYSHTRYSHSFIAQRNNMQRNNIVTAQRSKGISAEITRVSHPVLPQDTDLELTVTLTNTASSAVSVHQIIAQQSRTPLTNQSQLYAWMAHDMPAVAVSDSVQMPDAVIEAGEEREFTVTAPAYSLRWAHSPYRWAAHGVEVVVELETPGKNSREELRDRSVVVAEPNFDVAPMPLAAVTTLSSLDFPDATAAQGTAAHTGLEGIVAGSSGPGETQSSGVINSDSADSVGALAGVRGIADIAGVTALADMATLPQEFTDALKGLGRVEVTPTLPYNADLGALVHARNTEAGDLAARLTDNVLEASKALQGGEDDSLAYLYLSDKLDVDTLNTVRAQGFGTVLFDSDAAGAANQDQRPVSAHVTMHITPEDTPSTSYPLNGIRIDSILTNALAGTLHVPYQREGIALDTADTTNVAIALSAIHYNDAPSIARSNVFSYDARATSAEQISAILNVPWVSPVPLSQIAKEEPTPSEIVLPQTAINAREINAEELQRIDHNAALARGYLSLFDDDATLLPQLEPQMMSLLDMHYRTRESERSQAIDALAPSAALRGKITLEASSTINMISAEASVPLRVTNHHDKPVTAIVRIDPGRSPLTPTDDATVTIQPGVTVTARVPVQARASGIAQVKAIIVSPEGVEAGTPHTYTVNIHSNWESTGTIAFAVLTFAVLAIGIFRSVRGGSRAKPMSADEFTAEVGKRRKDAQR
ncbi:MAG: DUF6049 family protein [Arcanobacterium sp.]|nr:DUF6049 family protein [Arcanobacterium sp.]